MIYESMRKEFCVLGKRRRKKKESLTRIYGKSWEFNMLYYVEYSQSARKALRKLDKQTARIIKYWIEKNLINTDNPRIHGKELKGNLRSEEHTSELQSRQYLVCRLLLEKKKKKYIASYIV